MTCCRYDIGKYEFEKAIAVEPTFGMAYWGRALCSAQLLWNAEDVEESRAYLNAANASGAIDTMGVRERAYFDSVVTLNTAPGGTNPERGAEGATRGKRYANYMAAVQDLYAAYPDDSTAGSFVVLAKLAVSSSGNCTTSPFSAPCTSLQRSARDFASDLFERDPTFPGTLHYGIHAHDFANASIYNAGRHFAELYPFYVNNTCHSLHMPSHLYDRMGDFVAAEASNRGSVAAADTFGSSGALGSASDDGGPADIGDLPGLPFSFDAGNLYHSLEYEQYELLQQCEFDAARRLLARMSHATMQASDRLPAYNTGSTLSDASSSPKGEYAEFFGGAVYNATTFKQWELRMWARQVQFSVALDFLVPAFDDESAASYVRSATNARGAADWHAAIGSPRPLPLSWKGTTVYSHGFWSPQSEAGAWNAMGFAALADAAELASSSSAGASLVGSLAGLPAAKGKDGSCGGSWTAEVPASVHYGASLVATVAPQLPDGCIMDTAATALDRIEDAQEFYAASGVPFESATMGVLGLEVSALQKLFRGDTTGALTDAQAAVDAEHDALTTLQLPTSTTLFFLPADAINGIVSGWAAAAEPGGPEPLLLRAQASFQACLEPLVRPNHTVCLLGLARTSAALGDDGGATAAYELLNEIWHLSSTGSNCAPALAEVAAYLRPSEQPSQHPTTSPQHASKSAKGGFLGMGSGAVAGIAIIGAVLVSVVVLGWCVSKKGMPNVCGNRSGVSLRNLDRFMKSDPKDGSDNDPFSNLGEEYPDSFKARTASNVL